MVVRSDGVGVATDSDGGELRVRPAYDDEGEAGRMSHPARSKMHINVETAVSFSGFIAGSIHGVAWEFQ